MQRLLPKQSVSVQYQVWFEFTNKFANKCLDTSSLRLAAPNLHYITDILATNDFVFIN